MSSVRASALETVVARILPPGTALGASRVVLARALRAFCDGFIAILLPMHLLALGFGPLEIGAIGTATLLGSALLTLLVGFRAQGFDRRLLLLAAAGLMMATGLSFAGLTGFWPLLVVAFVGTINPTAGDVSVFLPIEQEYLANAAHQSQRTALFARYSLAGALFGALGSLAAGLPEWLGGWGGWTVAELVQVGFVVYAAVGGAVMLLYVRLPAGPAAIRHVKAAPLHQSRGIAYRLAALFSLDAFGGGLVVQSLLALWLFDRFGLSLADAASLFFWAGLCTAASQLAAAPIARRIGLVNTMVFTHLPANFCLMAVPFAPNLPIAIGLLLVRSTLSQMDVPPRTSYVMAVVTPEERPAVAGLTTVPRSLASAASPMLAGWMLGLSPFGWPLVLAGGCKAVYDLLLLAMFRHVKPPEERSP